MNRMLIGSHADISSSSPPFLCFPILLVDFEQMFGMVMKLIRF